MSDVLKIAVEKGVDRLVRVFLETPYMFYTESDLHCYLYHLLLENEPLSKPVTVKTREGREIQSILLHKEYPTKGFYRRHSNKDSELIGKKGQGVTASRGHFDLCVWNPLSLGDRFFRASGGGNEEETLLAMEFSLNEHWKTAEYHVQWDLLKLNDERNRVEQGARA